MVSEFSVKNMLPLNLWSKSGQTSDGRDPGSGGSASLLAQMPFGHPLAAAAAAAAAASTSGMFPVPSALFRPGADHAGHPGLYSYPAALHPSFFRPHIDPAALGSLLNQRAVAALHGSPEGGAHHPSAFLPATKRLRLDDSLSPRGADPHHSPHSSSPRAGDSDGPTGGSSRADGHDTSGSSNRTSPLTPVHRHSYSPAGGFGTLPRPTATTHGDHVLDSQYHSGAEDLRLKWRCEDGEGVRCPICKALLQPTEIRTHLYKEFNSLKETLQAQTRGNHSPDTHTHGGFGDNNESSKSRYDTFLRIRRNRETRLGKIRGDRKRKRFSDELSHTSVTEHEESMTTEPRVQPPSPQREPEEETVDVTSCEEPEVTTIYTSSPIPRQSTESSEDLDRNCPPQTTHHNNAQFTEQRPS